MIFLAVLLFSSIYASQLPKAHAAESTIQEEGLTILNDVISLDLAKYATEANEVPPYLYLDVVPQENLEYKLTSDESSLRMVCTFANGHLQLLQMLENKGSPHMTKTSVNSLQTAKDFLKNYETYTGDYLYGELESTLDNVNAGMNLTKTSGNTQLEVTVVNSQTTLKWTYTLNGVKAPSKFVALGFENSFLSAFVDNWNLYRIGSTSVNLTEEEAKTMALQTAKNYFLKLNADAFDAENFNEANVHWTALLFDCSVMATETRNEDLLMLYPVWRVGVGLDKWYGHLYGLEVDIWADTGQVRDIQEAWSTMPPPEGVPTANDNPVEAPTSQASNEAAVSLLDSQASMVAGAEPNLFMWIVFLAFATGIIGPTFVWLRRKKNSRASNLLKPRFFKTGGILFCILIASMILVVPVATVSAETGGAVVWGSESTGADILIDPYNTRKHQDEIGYQDSISSNISNYFYNSGYASFDYQGEPGSLKANILGNITYLQNNYARVAVVDFDHGVGRVDYNNSGEFHYMFEDDVGTWDEDDDEYYAEYGVYDIDIYHLTGSGKVFFAFINTCMSARIDDWECEYPEESENMYPAGQGFINDTHAQGMPFAWTHRTVKSVSPPEEFNVTTDMSDDGYWFPDGGPQVYIGFPWGSASLMQDIPYNESSVYYHQWVNHFFSWALSCDMSVNQALDHASWQYWGCYFSSCDLRLGFTCYWWHPNPEIPGTSDDCTMAVYGNGDIGLKPHDLTVNAYDSQSNPVTADVYIDDQYRGTSGNTFFTTAGTHTVRVESSTHVFHNFTNYDEFENPIEVSPTSDITVTANYYTNPPPQFTLSISAGEGGTTLSPWTPDDYECDPGSYITVTAAPDSGYEFDYWLLDEVQKTENPITFMMTGNRTLEAVFRNNWYLTVLALEDMFWTYGEVDLYIDDEYVGKTGYAYEVSAGQHKIEVPDELEDGGMTLTFDEWVETSDPDNPTTITVTSDTTITALYHVSF